jgi:hypothetical protein
MSKIPIQHTGRFIEATLLLQQSFQYDASGNIIFIGYSAPGSLKSDSTWLIIRNYYDSSDQMVDSRFADASINFDKIWDNRSYYSYSRE